MNFTLLFWFRCDLSFWSWRNKLRKPPGGANRNPIRMQKIKGGFIMVVYQPPVSKLPVPIGAYGSVNRFVFIVTLVVLVVSWMDKKYLFSGNMVNQKLLCPRFFIHHDLSRCRKESSFPFSYEEKWIGNRSIMARSDSSSPLLLILIFSDTDTDTDDLILLILMIWYWYLTIHVSTSNIRN